MRKIFSLLFFFISQAVFAGEVNCLSSGVSLQVLGSGGPEADDGLASSSYLIWIDGKAKILIDTGGGSFFRFEQSGASVNDLDVILLSHLHVDHSVDLPAFIKASFFTDRNRDLYLYGPDGNTTMPSTTNFVSLLLSQNGAYRYLSDYVDGSGRYRVVPNDMTTAGREIDEVFSTERYKIFMTPVHHGPIPAVAWKVVIDGLSIVFSGDMSNKKNTLVKLADKADILIAHNAIPEKTKGIARNLHMPPSEIGRIASTAKVKQLILSHRMKRTIGNEDETSTQIRQSYQGTLSFSDDMQCFSPRVTH